MNIVILGSGNIATHLGRAFKMAGQDIAQVWSRDLSHASALADTLAAEPIDNMFDLDRSADLYIIAVKDEVIRDIALGAKAQ
jgi:predicted dehydrogenase